MCVSVEIAVEATGGGLNRTKIVKMLAMSIVLSSITGIRCMLCRAGGQPPDEKEKVSSGQKRLWVGLPSDSTDMGRGTRPPHLIFDKSDPGWGG